MPASDIIELFSKVCFRKSKKLKLLDFFGFAGVQVFSDLCSCRDSLKKREGFNCMLLMGQFNTKFSD